MWRPEGFTDLDAAVGAAAESTDLDFKRQLSKPADIAKDITAMSIQGGVIAYGVIVYSLSYRYLPMFAAPKGENTHVSGN